MKNIDLTGLEGIDFKVSSKRAYDFGYQLEARSGSPEGTVIGQIVVRKGETEQTLEMRFNDNVKEEFQDLYIVSEALNDKETGNMNILSIEMIGK